MSNPNPENQFEKGVSGNPNGRPLKDESITNIIKEYMMEVKDIEGNRLEHKKIMIMKAYELAMKGDMTAIKFITSYHDGMPKQSIAVEGSISDNKVLSALRDVKNINNNNSDVKSETD